MPNDIPDLGELKERADARDAALREVQEKQALAEAQEKANLWDRAMRRAFKGICPRPQARATLMRSAAKHDSE